MRRVVVYADYPGTIDHTLGFVFNLIDHIHTHIKYIMSFVTILRRFFFVILVAGREGTDLCWCKKPLNLSIYAVNYLF